jgi:uncharacterized membrane protein YfcA
MTSDLLLIAAALVAGLMNAVAGGGSFFTFPALVFTGVPSIIANASSTVALLPGVLASAWGYRDDFQGFAGIPLKPVLLVSTLGGTGGALLLLYTPEHTFDAVVPWLLLTATLAFIFGPWLAPRLQKISHRSFRLSSSTLLPAQFVIGLYAGYFGGAIGLIMLAMWSLLGLTNVKAMNPNRTLLGGAMNAAAVVCFIVAGKIWWHQTLIMLVAAVVGGYVGARIGRRMNPRHIRVVVTIISVVITMAFFRRRL